MKYVISYILVFCSYSYAVANINTRGLPNQDDVVTYLRNEFSNSKNAAVSDIDGLSYSCQSYSAIKNTYNVSAFTASFNLIFPNIIAQMPEGAVQFRPLADGSLTSDESTVDNVYKFKTIRISTNGKLYIEEGDSIPDGNRIESIYNKSIFSSSYTTCTKN